MDHEFQTIAREFDRDEIERATAWLIDVMEATGGRIPAVDILRHASKQGIAVHHLNEARRAMPDIQVRRVGMQTFWVCDEHDITLMDEDG